MAGQQFTALFTDRRPRIESGPGDQFIFDASFSERHMVKNQWTSEPIEDGTTISDNVITGQRMLPMQVVVSSAELGGVFSNRDGAAWARFVTLAQQKPPPTFKVTTTLESLRNCVIDSVGATRTATTGTSLVADLVMRQLEFSATDVADNLSDAAQDLGQGNQNIGSQGLG